MTFTNKICDIRLKKVWHTHNPHKFTPFFFSYQVEKNVFLLPSQMQLSPNSKQNAQNFFFTSRRPRELILGMSKCVLHDSWIICTPLPSRMHIRKPHVEVACTHHILGDVTPSISKCSVPTRWGKSIYVRPIDSPHTFLLQKYVVVVN